MVKMKKNCLKTLSEYCERRCRGNMRWKNCSRNWCQKLEKCFSRRERGWTVVLLAGVTLVIYFFIYRDVYVR